MSDHSITEIFNERVVDLPASMSMDSVQDIRISPLVLWKNMNESAEKVAHDNVELLKQNKHAFAYLKDSVPERWKTQSMYYSDRHHCQTRAGVLCIHVNIWGPVRTLP